MRAWYRAEEGKALGAANRLAMGKRAACAVFAMAIFSAAGLASAAPPSEQIALLGPSEQFVVPALLGPSGEIVAPLITEDDDDWRDVARCGAPAGIGGRRPAPAPVIAKCSRSGQRRALATRMVIGAGLGYTGTVTAVVTGQTFGGTFKGSCDFIAWGLWPHIPARCSGQVGAIGYEPVVLEGEADGFGLWEVAYQEYAP